MENEDLKKPGEWRETAQTYNDRDRVKHHGQEWMLKEKTSDEARVQYLLKRVHQEKFFERAWWIIVAIIAIGSIGWAICGEWIEALCGATWLYVAWMYWRRQKDILTITEMMLDLSKVKINQDNQIACYTEMVLSYREMITIQADHLKHKDEKIENLKHYIECQDTIIEHYKKDHQ